MISRMWSLRNKTDEHGKLGEGREGNKLQETLNNREQTMG